MLLQAAARTTHFQRCLTLQNKTSGAPTNLSQLTLLWARCWPRKRESTPQKIGHLTDREDVYAKYFSFTPIGTGHELEALVDDFLDSTQNCPKTICVALLSIADGACVTEDHGCCVPTGPALGPALNSIRRTVPADAYMYVTA